MITAPLPPPATSAERLERAFAAVEADMAALWLQFNGTHATDSDIKRMMDALSDQQMQAKLQAHLDDMEPAKS